jgi:hypothetical protein
LQERALLLLLRHIIWRNLNMLRNIVYMPLISIVNNGNESAIFAN